LLSSCTGRPRLGGVEARGALVDQSECSLVVLQRKFSLAQLIEADGEIEA